MGIGDNSMGWVGFGRSSNRVSTEGASSGGSRNRRSELKYDGKRNMGYKLQRIARIENSRVVGGRSSRTVRKVKLVIHF